MSATKTTYADVLKEDYMKRRKKPLGTGARFDALSAELKRTGAKDPDALAATIGRRKLGNQRFNALAAAGRRRKKRK